jgi:hypothetical protein
LFDGGLQRVRFAPGDGDGRAVTDKRLGDGETDAARCTGDEGAPAGEAEQLFNGRHSRYCRGL